jgi:hypothetical protein
VLAARLANPEQRALAGVKVAQALDPRAAVIGERPAAPHAVISGAPLGHSQKNRPAAVGGCDPRLPKARVCREPTVVRVFDVRAQGSTLQAMNVERLQDALSCRLGQ